MHSERDIWAQWLDPTEAKTWLANFPILDGTLSAVRPVHLLRVFRLRVLESDFPGDSL